MYSMPYVFCDTEEGKEKREINPNEVLIDNGILGEARWI